MEPLTAFAIGGGLNLAGNFLGSSAQKDAIEAQRKQFKQYLNLLREQGSREYIYSPEQLQTQERMFPLQWAMLNQALGTPEQFYSYPSKQDFMSEEMKKYDEKSPLPAISAPAEPKFSPLSGRSIEANSWAKALDNIKRKKEEKALTAAEGKRGEYEEEAAGRWENIKTGQETGKQLYEALRESQEQALSRQAGAERSALDVGKRNALSSLLSSNRAMMGGGTSGHIAGQMGDLEESYMRAVPQIATARETRMQDWRNQQAQGAMSGLMNMGFQQPLGNQPFMPPQPPAPAVDMTGANTLSGLGNLAMMYSFMKGTSPYTSSGTGGRRTTGQYSWR